MNDLRISDVRFTSAPLWGQDKCLLGWASGVVDDRLGVGGMGVRRTQQGAYTLSFPSDKNPNGNVHHHIWPPDSETRRSIEAQVLGKLREQGVLP